MPSKIHVHPTMLAVVHSILPKRLLRADLIAKSMSFEAYGDKEKAEKFVARQVHRLTKLGLLVSHGSRSSRWYEPSEDLTKLVSDFSLEEPLNTKAVLDELVMDEARLENEISLALSELEEMRALSVRFPILSADADGMISNERSRITSLYGKLSAVRKLKASAEKLEAKQC
ncbi:hypothetical protein C8D85_3426 [Marinomonas communis]|uniref:Uncharacterized protein n=1 Tax=Marinomonas communis TaxID=28254 RepID=A0A4R6WXR6_9GAMM|nr:hypothetical protein C8D85_3426 [Marinomonas communis]